MVYLRQVLDEQYIALYCDSPRKQNNCVKMSAGYVSVTNESKSDQLSLNNEQVDNIQFYRPREIGPFNFKNAYSSLRRKPFFVLMAALFTVVFVIVVISIIVVAVNRKSQPVSQSQPKFIQYNLKQNGLNFFPPSAEDSTLINFRPMKYNSYAHFYNYLNGFLHDYNILNQANPEKYVDCNKDYAPSNKVCKFTAARLGHECSTYREYGYHAGTPCILFMLNMPPNTKPEPFPKSEMDEALGTSYSPDTIGITCKGATEKDEHLIGKHYVHDNPPIQYFPENGFETYFYRNQTGEYEFLRPLVMVKFNTVPDHEYVNITCRAWVKNIQKDEVQNYTSSFEIYMH